MLVQIASGTPVPTPTPTVDPDLITPGFPGFVVIVIVVVGVALLIWDMNRRIRRVRYREEVREELDAEEAAARAEEQDGGAARPGRADGEADAESDPKG